jgi:cathepsin B
LSPQTLLDCDHFDHGCAGGDIKQAFEFLEKEGIRSLQCNPYTSFEGELLNQCMDDEVCESGTPDTYKCQSHSMRIFEDPTSIKQEILQNGPLTTFFLAYTDLLYYKKGIYHHKKGTFGGGHAVKIVGWGRQKKDNYWIIANSWGEEWGIDGYFWFKEGELRVDSFVVGCEPEL